MRTRLCAGLYLLFFGLPAVTPAVSAAQSVASGQDIATRLPPLSDAKRASPSPSEAVRTQSSVPPDGAVLNAAQPGRELSIQDLQRLALAGNNELQAARQEIAAARGLLTQTRLRPNPGVDLSFGTGRPLGSAGEREFEIGYAHTFELGGKRDRRIDVGRVGVEIAELIVMDRERQLIAEVKTRYAEALAAGRNLQVLNELSELTDRAYRAAQQRVAEGEAAPVERALLQVEAGRLTADRLLAASASTRAVAALKLAAGIDASESIGVRGDLKPPAVALPLEDVIARALSERADLKAARAEEARGEAELRLAHAERVPDVIGLAQYGRVQSQFPQLGLTATGQLTPLRDTDQLLTVGVSIPLPFANRNQGNIEASMARRQAATLRRQFVEQTVRTEAIAAHTQYIATLRALEAFGQDVVDQSQESLKIIRASYDLGEVELLDLLQEQRRVVETQKAYTEVLKEHYIARAALDAAVGTEVK